MRTPRWRAQRARRAGPPSTRPIDILVLCGAFLIALVVGVILSNPRHHAIEQGKQQLLATATVLARQAARDFQSIDLIEANLIEYMETLAIVSDELYARAMVGRGIHLMLKDKISGFPHIGAVMLIGADGRRINSSQAWPTPPLNFAGQDCLEALKSKPRLESMLGTPTRDSQTGRLDHLLRPQIQGIKRRIPRSGRRHGRIAVFREILRNARTRDRRVDGAVSWRRRTARALSTYRFLHRKILCPQLA